MATGPRGAGVEDPGSRAAPASSLDAWVEDHADAMFRYALLRLGDRERAEDAVQEAFLAAIGSSDRFAGRSAVRTWLIGILRNKVIDTMRRDSRERRVRREIADDGVFVCGRWAEHQPEAPWPDRGTPEWAELRSALEEAILELPSPMREAFCLRVLDGSPAERVCETLGLSRSNLWTLVHRAKIRLRAWLDDRWFDHRGEAQGAG